jgi:hypothetical protein
MRKKIVLFDFDGVLHSYKSGWQGATKITDPPVEGALEFLCSLTLSEEYATCIYSSRSSKFGGRTAMRRWLAGHLFKELYTVHNKTPRADWRWKVINLHQSYGYGSWEAQLSAASDALIKQIDFPKTKPPAFLTIDDRAICFDGDFSTLLSKIEKFKPWYSGGV